MTFCQFGKLWSFYSVLCSREVRLLNDWVTYIGISPATGNAKMECVYINCSCYNLIICDCIINNSKETQNHTLIISWTLILGLIFWDKSLLCFFVMKKILLYLHCIDYLLVMLFNLKKKIPDKFLKCKLKQSTRYCCVPNYHKQWFKTTVIF